MYKALQELKDKLEALSASKEFKEFKPKYKQRVHLMINLIYELLPIYDEGEETQTKAIDLILEVYESIYDKTDHLRKVMFKPKKIGGEDNRTPRLSQK